MTQPYLSSDIAEIDAGLGELSQRLADKCVVVTGAGGFLGTYFLAFFDHLNRHLLARPVRVLAYDSFIASISGPESLRAYSGVELRTRNITEPIELAERIDFVVHAAGIASPVWYRTHPLETLDVSIAGTRNMLEAARAHHAVFLHFSSSEIYGNPDPRHVPTSEAYLGNVSCRGPRACYDEGKRVSETLCDIYHNYFGVHTVVVRPFNVFGPGMRQSDYRVLPNFASRIRSGRPLDVYGSGEQTRTFCYVVDALEGFLRAMLLGVPGETYNIGNPDPEITIAGLAQRIRSVLGPRVEYRLADYPEAYPSNEPQRRCPDITKARLHLGFEPSVPLEDGLARFFGWTEKAYVAEGTRQHATSAMEGVEGGVVRRIRPHSA